MSAQIIVC